METAEPGSVSRWIAGLKEGDPAAAEPLWDRYFARLVELARRKLLATRRRGADADEEDAAISAFDSFCQGAVSGRFPRLQDRDDLWKILVVITARKAFGQASRRASQKRGGQQNRLEIAEDADQADWVLESIVSREPTPEFAAMFAEEYERRLNALVDPSLQQVALWRLDGYNNDEIAARLGCARRTVARRLDLIRRLWESDADPVVASASTTSATMTIPAEGDGDVS